MEGTPGKLLPGKMLENEVYHNQLDVQQGTFWPLYRGFAPGSQLVINGTVKTGADRFHFDLVTTSGVAFHFNPRFKQNAVVTNSQRGTTWEREIIVPLPFKPGQYFSISIFCLQSGLQVLVNGQVFTHFNHRQIHQSITHFRYGGDVQLIGAVYYSKQAEGSGPRTLPNFLINLDVHQGHLWSLPFGFGPGTKLVIHGSAGPNADRFALNLWSPEGIAFHFNPRFKEGVVVLNSETEGKWGREQREKCCLPLSPGQFFIIELLCQTEGIQVVVNGDPFTHYAHRHDPFSFKDLSIMDDVKLHLAYHDPALDCISSGSYWSAKQSVGGIGWSCEQIYFSQNIYTKDVHALLPLNYYLVYEYLLNIYTRLAFKSEYMKRPFSKTKIFSCLL